MKIKAVIFDLDGTLLNTIKDIADSANFTLKKFGYPTHPADSYRYFVGNGVDNLIKVILPEEARSPETMLSFKKIYLERYGTHSMETTRPYDGVPEMIAELKNMRLKLAVASNKPDAATKSTISDTFAEETFNVVLGGRSDVPLKPDPTIVHNILGEFGVPPAEALFVGDTSVDLETAKNAGCPSVGVLWGFRPEEAANSGADFVIAHPFELTELIRRAL